MIKAVIEKIGHATCTDDGGWHISDWELDCSNGAPGVTIDPDGIGGWTFEELREIALRRAEFTLPIVVLPGGKFCVIA